MAWIPKVHPKVAGRLQSTPNQPNEQTDEPQEVIISDQPKPVTAKALVERIKANNQEKANAMSDTQRRAAEPADASGKPDKRVDTEGVGGVADASNEQASKADKQVDVEGKGGVIQDSNAEAAKPDQRTDVAKEVRTDDSGPTKTWDNSNEPNSAVTEKAGAKQGVKPIGGGDVQPQRRENVEQDSGFSNPQSGTDQWTGTGGNGVTRQADPVTKKVDPNIDQGKSSSILFTAFKLADREVDLGLTAKEAKFDRIAELESQTAAELEAQLATLDRVKTAGLSKQASPTRQATRVPSMSRAASVSEAQPVDDSLIDSALFSR